MSRLATHYGFIDNGKLIKELTASELEAQCRKKILIKATGKKALSTVLDKTDYEYKMLSPDECEIYGEINVNDTLKLLADNELIVSRISEKDEDLETYFINLVGGEVND